MATGRERRAERLNERLRGAQRTNVEDESFHIDIPGLGSFPEPSPARTSPARTSPSAPALTSVQDDAEEAPPSTKTQPSSARRSSRFSPRDAYQLPETTAESIAQSTAALQPDEPPELPETTAEPVMQVSSAARSVASQRATEPELPDVLPSHGEPSFLSPKRARRSRIAVEEIEESPADAPSSGKRRNVPVSDALTTSARLHDALDVDEEPQSSSPLERKARRSSFATVRSSRRSSSRLAEQMDVDDLSPERPRDSPPADEELGEPRSREESEQAHVESEAEHQSDGLVGEEQELEEQPEEEHESEEAEEINAVEAAKTLGRKRHRISLPSRSPELGSQSQEEETEEDEQPVAKRQRGRPSKSPATQRQPAAKQKPQKKAAEPKSQRKPEPKPKAKPAKPRRESDDNHGPSIEITVQRFVNLGRSGADDQDPLLSDMPFANRVGETVVDVFAQVCMEVINSTMEQFTELAMNTEDRSKKKELRVKIRAIEAYREELNSRLLQHAIHLNDWHSLRKRVRHVQKEKLSLRDEIMQLKAEREQVALQMDAVRVKHEEESKDSTYRLNTSSLMHDVDLAIEQGRGAPELSHKEQKDADLANLELLVSQICDEASSASASGGILNQVKDFNAFLERAAIALETR